jgi:hypothetical protein
VIPDAAQSGGPRQFTRAAGKCLAVMHRRVKNRRLAAVGYT